MEVENKNKVSSFKDNELVTFMSQSDILMSTTEPFELILELIDSLVKIFKLRISQSIIICKMPLSSAIMIAESISLSWKIYPLWMPEFITHKVKIALTT